MGSQITLINEETCDDHPFLDSLPVRPTPGSKRATVKRSEQATAGDSPACRRGPHKATGAGMNGLSWLSANFPGRVRGARRETFFFKEIVR
jgi:hypothetical protein